MPETAGGRGAAFDATTATEDNAPQAITQAHVDYLTAVADQEAEAVVLAERQIEDLQAALAERRATADRAKKDLAEGRKRLKRQEG